MRSTALLILCGTLMAGTATVGAAEKKRKTPAIAHPLPVQAPYSVEGPDLWFRGQGVEMAARHVSEGKRGNYLGLPIDPFAARAFTTFFITLKNVGSQTVSLNPAFISIDTGGRQQFYPVEYGNIYSFVEQLSGGDPVLAERLMGRFFHQPKLLHPGDATHGLLLFDDDVKGSEFVLEVDALFIGTASIDLRFPFQVEPRKKKKKKRRS